MDLSVSQQGLCCAELVSFFVMNGIRSDGFYGPVSFSVRTLLCGVVSFFVMNGIRSGGFYGPVSFSARTLLCGFSFFLCYLWCKVRRFCRVFKRCHRKGS